MKHDNIYVQLFGIDNPIYDDKVDSFESILGVDMDLLNDEFNKTCKCPKDIINFKKEYKELYENFKKEIVYIVNNLNKTVVVDKSLKHNINIMFGTLNQDDTKMYFKNSILWNGEYHNYPIDSNIFKARFICNLLCEIKLNMDRIIESQFRYKGRKLLEYEDKYFILNDIYHTVKDFIHRYISDEYTYEDFIRLNKLFASRGDVKKRKKIIHKMNDVSPMILKISEIRRLNGEEEFELINDIFNISYMISTDNHSLKNRRSICDKIRFIANYGMRRELTKLGEDIFIETNINNSTPILYRAFYNARPEIHTKFTRYNSDLQNKFLILGIKSVFYLGFMFNNKRIYKYIDLILK